MYDLTSFEMLCIRNILSVHYFVGDHGKCKYLVPFFGCFFFFQTTGTIIEGPGGKRA